MLRSIYGCNKFFLGSIQFVFVLKDKRRVWVVASDVRRQEYSQRQNSLPRFSSFNSTIDLFGFPLHLGDKARGDKKKITQP